MEGVKVAAVCLEVHLLSKGINLRRQYIHMNDIILKSLSFIALPETKKRTPSNNTKPPSHVTIADVFHDHVPYLAEAGTTPISVVCASGVSLKSIWPNSLTFCTVGRILVFC